jgi:sec-independent protein translocase protein TatA
MHVGWQEILVVLLIALLLFGAKRIPELAKSLGKGIRDFKKTMKEIERPLEKEDKKSDEKSKE